ncbi:MAG: glucosamine-6-phosphate deaminase [Oscillospiraceae bacterium]|jgi:glucosamine-6-phosphate deaminase|nr:glucosamine-6-phosphate deaminase [Oscillospiraceae bacterium]
MKLINAKDYNDMSRKAANILSAQVIIKPRSVLGLATGSTPIGTYKQLIEWYNKGDIDFSETSSVNLDEYVGLQPDNNQSYRYFMNTNFFDHININKNSTHVPNGVAEDVLREAKRYDELISTLGGIDLQLLGLGPNGHIGFNEPGGAFENSTHCVSLTEETITANKRFFANIDEVPRKAITMGMKGIMQAKKILLIVSGKAKQDILTRALYGPITPEVPASLLQIHNDLTVITAFDK